VGRKEDVVRTRAVDRLLDGGEYVRGGACMGVEETAMGFHVRGDTGEECRVEVVADGVGVCDDGLAVERDFVRRRWVRFKMRD